MPRSIVYHGHRDPKEVEAGSKSLTGDLRCATKSVQSNNDSLKSGLTIEGQDRALLEPYPRHAREFDKVKIGRLKGAGNSRCATKGTKWWKARGFCVA